MLVRECYIGEITFKSGTVVMCKSCNAGTYSFNLSDTSCKKCPENAICHGTDEMDLNHGFSRVNKHSITFINCR